MVPRADVLLDASNTEVHVYARGTKERMRAQAVVVLTAVALVACYARTLRGMFEQWSTDEDMSHGFVVPIVALWIVWRERARWQSLPAEPSRWGFVVLAAGAGMQFIAQLGAGLFAG